MIFGLAGVALGVIYGIWRARKSKGNAFDQMQYAAAFGMFFGLMGLILAIIVFRLG